MDAGHEYAAPHGTVYSNGTLRDKDGSTELTTFDAWVPDATDAKGTDTETTIDPSAHEYSQSEYRGSDTPPAPT